MHPSLIGRVESPARSRSSVTIYPMGTAETLLQPGRKPSESRRTDRRHRCFKPGGSFERRTERRVASEMPPARLRGTRESVGRTAGRQAGRQIQASRQAGKQSPAQAGQTSAQSTGRATPGDECGADLRRPPVGTAFRPTASGQAAHSPAPVPTSTILNEIH